MKRDRIDVVAKANVACALPAIQFVIVGPWATDRTDPFYPT